MWQSNDAISCKCTNVQIYHRRKKVELSYHTTAAFSGTIKASRGEQPIELDCRAVDIIGTAPHALMPFKEKNQTTMEWPKLRQWPHLRPRATRVAAAMRVRSALITEVHRFMEREEYLHVTTPIITGNDCEGAGDTFKVVADTQPVGEPFFGHDAHLTVSAQLHLEAMAA